VASVQFLVCRANHHTWSFLGFTLIIQIYGFLLSKQSTQIDTQLVYFGQNCQPHSITDLEDRDQRQYVPANRSGAMHQCIHSGAVDTHPVPGIRVISRYLLAPLLFGKLSDLNQEDSNYRCAPSKSFLSMGADTNNLWLKFASPVEHHGTSLTACATATACPARVYMTLIVVRTGCRACGCLYVV
jgi:hypothetical protein